MHTVLSVVSQVIFAAGIIALLYLVIAKMRGGGLSLIWPLCILAGGIPPYVVAERIRSHWAERLRTYLQMVPQYGSVLSAFPNAEILLRRPAALMGSAPEHSDKEKEA